ncbi:MAG: hypothetical protein JSV79_10365 [Armatimonadota bacterium]|nr:MAG: hypothetical protein JSV79_10365 [Armatimonadota bacterium]
MTHNRSRCRIPNVVSVLLMTLVPFFCPSCGGQKEPSSEAPPGASIVCKLFVANDEPSREAYSALQNLRREYGHQLHVVCLPTTPPDSALTQEMQRYDVKAVPCAVLDGYWVVSDPTEEELRRAVDSCLEKRSPGLSMEMLAGPIADRYSVTFEACNLTSKLDFDGIVEVYITEHGVPIGPWSCDHVFRGLIHTEQKYHISSGKCQTPILVSWPIPAGTDPSKLRALVILYDSSHKLLDSLCSHSECTRASVCPGLH